MGKRSRAKRLKKQQPRVVKTSSIKHKYLLILTSLAVLTILIISVWLLVLGQTKTQAISPTPIQATPNSTPDSSYHDFVMESVRMISSGHPRAEQLYQFFRERMVRAIAFEPDVYTYEFDPPTPTQIALVVNKHRTDANRYTARYFRNRKALEIYDISYNRYFVGTIVLHELSHAWDFMITGYPVGITVYDELFLQSEIDAYQLELELANKASRGLLLNQIRLLVEQKRYIYPKSLLFSLSLSDYNFLNVVFGLVVSDYERGMRVPVYVYGINREMLERTDLNQLQKNRALKDWYQRYYLLLLPGYGN